MDETNTNGQGEQGEGEGEKKSGPESGVGEGEAQAKNIEVKVNIKGGVDKDGNVVSVEGEISINGTAKSIDTNGRDIIIKQDESKQKEANKEEEENPQKEGGKRKYTKKQRKIHKYLYRIPINKRSTRRQYKKSKTTRRMYY